MKMKPFLKEGIPTVTVTAASDVEGLVLVDVRRPDEFIGELGHVKGSVLKTLGPELDEYLKTANRESEILFICRSGARSANATGQAMALGFKKVYNMEGGMIYWNEKGLEVSRDV